MPVYHIHEGSYELPAGWRDESVIIHSAGDPTGPARFSLVVNRTQPQGGEGFIELAERQIDELRRALPGFTVIDQRQRIVDGVLALEATFSWASDRGPMHQRQIYVPAGATILVITASALEQIPPQHAHELEVLLATFRFRRGA